MGILLIISFVCIGLAFNLLAPDTSQAMGPLNRTYITNTTELIQFRDRVNAGLNTTGVTVRLVNDIDMNGVTWNAGIGNTAANAFRGNFEGNGFTISNMQGAGLFAYINNAVVQNLNFIGGAFSTAPLVSRVLTSSTIANVHFVGNSTLGLVRNIAGLNSFIRDSSFAGTITSSDTITGGIVRNVTSDSHISIERVAFDGVLNANVGVSTASVISAGGLIGNLTRGSNAVINDSLVRGSISLSASATGTGGSIQAAGILGFTNNNSGGGQTALATSMTVRRTLVAATIYSRGTTTTNWRHVSSAGIGVMNGTNTARFDIFDTIIVSPSITTSLGARQRSATVAVIQRYNSSHTVPVVNITNLRRLDSIVVGASVGTIPTEFPVTLNNSQTAMHPMSWFQNAANITNTMGWDANIWSPANGNPDGLPVLNRNNNTASLGNDDGTWQATNIPITGWEGAGTAANPWRIRNARHFAGIAYVANKEDGVNNAARLAVRNGHFILMNDIDLSSRTWIPIQSFSGTLNGGGQTITLPSELRTNGIFRTVSGANAAVRNLVLTGEGAVITTTDSGAGLISGWVSGGAVIENVINKSSFVVDRSGAGAIGIGSIAGWLDASTIRNTLNFGNVTAILTSAVESAHVGGLVGDARGGAHFMSVGNYGNVSINTPATIHSRQVGGVAGVGWQNFSVINSYNRGNLSANNNNPSSGTGGILGFATGGTINNVYNLGTVSGAAPLGQIIGRVSGAATVRINERTSAINLWQNMINGRGTNDIWATWVQSINRTAFHPNATAIVNVPMHDFTNLMSWQDEFIPDTDWFFNDVSADSFYISTNRELAGLAYIVNNNYHNFNNRTITLEDDIDLRGRVWVPIGRYEQYTDIRHFRGTFDGQLHSVLMPTLVDIGVSNLYGHFAAGLFGTVNNSHITNLVVLGNITGIVGDTLATSHVRISPVVGQAIGTNVINNVVNKANITIPSRSHSMMFGGIVALAHRGQTTIINVANYGDIIYHQVGVAQGTAGGILGWMGSATPALSIINSYNRGNITITGTTTHAENSAAGIIGIQATGNVGSLYINNVYNSGAISHSVSGRAFEIIGVVRSPVPSSRIINTFARSANMFGAGGNHILQQIGTFNFANGQLLTGGTGTLIERMQSGRNAIIAASNDFTTDDVWEWIQSTNRIGIHENATAVLDVPMLSTPLLLTWQDANIPLTAWADAANRGTAANPFLISNERELAGLAYLVNNNINNFEGQYIRLTRNMDLRSRIWVPIGTVRNINNPRNFRGSFNGGFHSVYLPSTLTAGVAEGGNWSATGLFGAVVNSDISNLIVRGNIQNIKEVYEPSTSGMQISPVIGITLGAQTKITNVVNFANIELDTFAARSFHLGGIVGAINGDDAKLLNVANYGNFNYIANTTVLASSSIAFGGIIGLTASISRNTQILNSYNRGNINLSGNIATGILSGVGGLIGVAFQTGSTLEVQNFFNTGDLANVMSANRGQGVGAFRLDGNAVVESVNTFRVEGGPTSFMNSVGTRTVNWFNNARFNINGQISELLVNGANNIGTGIDHDFDVGDRLLGIMNNARVGIADASAFVPSTWLVEGGHNFNIPMFRFLFDGETDTRVMFETGAAAGASATHTGLDRTGRNFLFEPEASFVLNFDASLGNLIYSIRIVQANGIPIDIILSGSGTYFSYELGGYIHIELHDVSNNAGLPRRVRLEFENVNILLLMGAQIVANTAPDLIRVNFDPNGGYMPAPWYQDIDGYYYRFVYFGRLNTPILPIPTTTKDGYVFTGWWTLPNGGARVINEFGMFGTIWNRTNETTLYARWISNNINVTLINGNTTSSVVIVHNTPAGFGFGAPVHENDTYNFLGWFSAPLIFDNGYFYLEDWYGNRTRVDEAPFRITGDDGLTLGTWTRTTPTTIFAVFDPPVVMDVLTLRDYVYNDVRGQILRIDEIEIDGEYERFLMFLAAGERVVTVMDQFVNDNALLRVFRRNGDNEETGEVLDVENEVVATNMLLALYVGGERVAWVVFVVRGDLLGRGTVDVTDIAILQQHIFAEFDFELVGAFLLAADTLDRGTVDVTDIAMLQQHIFAEFNFCMFDVLWLGDVW